MIGQTMEVHIDDVVVKSSRMANHLFRSWKGVLENEGVYAKMNLLKCAFGVTAGNFLEFLVYQRGIEIDKNKAWAI